MSLHDRIVDAIEACRKDLTRVADDLKWAMEPGLSPEGRGLGAPRGSALMPRDDDHQDDPDFVAGPRYALDIGDHQVRTAFLTAVEHLAVAELRTAFAVAAMHTEASQPKPVRPDQATSFRLIDVCRIGIERRLTIVERDLELVATVDMKIVGFQINGARHPDKPSARRALDLAVRALEKALTRGLDVDGAAVKKCWVCKIRPEAEKTGHRCNTCSTWKARNPNRGERPQALDDDMLSAAKQAKERRRARGEDWGIG